MKYDSVFEDGGAKGIAFVGAYQETLGDLHNLFGDTNVVTIALRPDGGFELVHDVEGDTIAEVLSYVEYDPRSYLDAFKRIAEEVKFPIVPYNVPGRTGSNVLPATVARLAELPDVVGIKEATGSLQQVSDVIGLSGDKIAVLSGDDFVTLPMLAVGGKGVISVVANLAPADVATMCDAYAAGDLKRAQELHYKLRPLTDACFIETNPIPTKSALAMMGMISGELRLPLCEMGEENRKVLKTLLKNMGVLK